MPSNSRCGLGYHASSSRSVALHCARAGGATMQELWGCRAWLLAALIEVWVGEETWDRYTTNFRNGRYCPPLLASPIPLLVPWQTSPDCYDGHLPHWI